MDWGLLLAGLFVGIMIGMTGVGGGSLMTPLLIFGFSFPPAVAVGTDLLFAGITKATGIWSYWRLKAIQWRVVLLLALGSVPASLLTLWIMQVTGMGNGAHSEVITKALGIALILTSTALLVKSAVGRFMQNHQTTPIVSHMSQLQGESRYKIVLTVVTGIFIGVMVTISSVGAGALGTAVLLFLYPKLKPMEIVGTDIAHAVPLTLIAGIGHATTGTTDWGLLSYLLIGSLPGIFIGSRLGALVSEKVMRTILAIILLAVGIKCII